MLTYLSLDLVSGGEKFVELLDVGIRVDPVCMLL